MRGDVELDAAEVAGAEHLDRLALADRAGRDQLVDADRAALGEQLGEPARLTTWYSTRKRFLKPLSLGSRMWSGIWPPSKPAGTW